MKRLWFTFFAGFLLVLGACSGYKYNTTRVQQLDFTQYETYGWLPPVDSLSKNYFNNDISRANIMAAANHELESRGLRYSKENPDILFRYIPIVNNKSRMVYGHSGWGWGGPWGYSPWWGYGWRMGPSYPVGKEKLRYAHLIIEARDRRTNSVVWQARGSGSIKTPEEAINDLPKIVQGIFKEYPSK